MGEVFHKVFVPLYNMFRKVKHEIRNLLHMPDLCCCATAGVKRSRSSRRLRKSNVLLYSIITGIAFLFFSIFFHLRIIKNRNAIDAIQPPFVVVSNHISNIDTLLVASAILPRTMHFVASSIYFNNLIYKWLLYQLGSISKKQFHSDILSIRKIKSAIAANGIVAIFPAGQSSYNGSTTDISISTAKLLKHLSVPVIYTHISGAHIAFPKWNMSRFRKSVIEVKVDVLFNNKDICEYSTTEINSRLKQVLFSDDYEQLRHKKYISLFKRNISGLENILFICPKCNAEHSFIAYQNQLQCNQCGFTSIMDKRGFLQNDSLDYVIDTPPKWHNWQKQYYQNIYQHQDSNAIYFEAQAFLYIISANKKTKLGNSIVRITKQNLSITCDSIGFSHTIDNSTPTLIHEKPNELAFYIADDFHVLEFSLASEATKLLLLKDLIYGGLV